jgi:hypothetical protein
MQFFKRVMAVYYSFKTKTWYTGYKVSVSKIGWQNWWLFKLQSSMLHSGDQTICQVPYDNVKKTCFGRKYGESVSRRSFSSGIFLTMSRTAAVRLVTRGVTPRYEFGNFLSQISASAQSPVKQ